VLEDSFAKEPDVTFLWVYNFDDLCLEYTFD